jgi:hypothetical protein
VGAAQPIRKQDAKEIPATDFNIDGDVLAIAEEMVKSENSGQDLHWPLDGPGKGATRSIWITISPPAPLGRDCLGKGWRAAEWLPEKPVPYRQDISAPECASSRLRSAA